MNAETTGITQTDTEQLRAAQAGTNTLTAKCSRAGCTQAAVWRLDWRNPRVHREAPGKTGKTWLACEEHLVFLRDFLASRDFPLAVERFEVPA